MNPDEYNLVVITEEKVKATKERVEKARETLKTDVPELKRLERSLAALQGGDVRVRTKGAGKGKGRGKKATTATPEGV